MRLCGTALGKFGSRSRSRNPGSRKKSTAILPSSDTCTFSQDEAQQPVGGARVYHLGLIDCPPVAGMAGAQEKAKFEAGRRVGKPRRAVAGFRV